MSVVDVFGALRRAVHLWVLLGTLLAGLAQAAAAPSGASQPMLRIDPETHTAMVRAAAFDASRQRIYTASDDKTVRIWQLPDAQPVGTLRVPILDGAEGQLYALALSPDGRWLAVGGWTGWEWEQQASVYLFDTETQALVRRIPVAPWTITTLRFSPDGQYIAVGLHGEGGLVIVQRESGARVAADPAYKSQVMALDYDRYGRLFSVALDGFVRLYKQDHTLLARRAMASGKEPVTLRVSTDSRWLAVGFGDAPVIELINAEDLSAAGQLKAASTSQGDVVVLAWSGDGQYLYASGTQRSGANSVLQRWRLPAVAGTRPIHASARAQVIQAMAGRINDLVPMSSGRMLFVSDRPSVGWVEASGKVREPVRAAQWHFAGAATRLLVAADGAQVKLSIPKQEVLFSVPKAQLDWAPRNKSPGLRPPLLQAKGWSVRVSSDRRALTLNGQPVALEEYEKVHSHAIAHDRSRVVVGTEWALRAFDAQGAPTWMSRVSSPVWSVNVSADGHVVVAALGDGTLRWFAMRTGQELLSLFMHRNASDWVAWVPGGSYASSPHGDRHIGWHINRGLDQSPDFVFAVQLERVLYRPDLIRAALSPQPAQATPQAKTAGAMSPEQMNRMAPPRVHLRLLGIDPVKQVARVLVEAEKVGPAMRDLAVYVNGLPVTAASDRGLRFGSSSQIRREYEIALSAPVNDIRVEAFTEVSMGLARTQVLMTGSAPPRPPRGNLYLLAIGASRFEHLPESAWLGFASKDADTFAATLKGLAGAPFEQRHVKTLSDTADERPTRRNILQALEFLKRATADDTVVLFLASHGVSDAGGNYYFVPSDAQPADLNGLLAADDPQTLLSWQVFFDVLRVVAGRRLMVVDTCQARGIEGRFDPNALIKRSASSQFALMVASGADEESQEYDPVGHGLFTYGLLSSLSAAQAQPRTQASGPWQLRDWFAETARVVNTYRDLSIGPQTPQFLAPAVLQDTVIIGRPEAR